MRIAHDVTLERQEAGEFIAISRNPAVVGETLALTMANGAGKVEIPVRVLESAPALVGGRVCHRLRLRGTAATREGPG